MKNRKNALLCLILAAGVLTLTACDFGRSSNDNGDIVVEEAQQTPEAETEAETEAEEKEMPEPEETIAPDVNTSTTYTSADGIVSIKVPDATWANKTDGNGVLSFESPKQGKIVIVHGADESKLASTVLPNSEDIANTLEKANGLEEGSDYKIRNYKAELVGSTSVFSYTTRIMNKEKSDYAFVVHKVYANNSEFFTIEGYAINKAALSGVKKAVNSFAILKDSSLMEAAPKKSGKSQKADTTAEDTGNTAPQEAPAAELDINDDNMSDIEQTRTIYSNDGSGQPRVIQMNAEGVWVDAYGNTYRFENGEDVYDQNDVDWYWGGEAADVYYMDTEEYYEE